jgi:hypothetical protein
MKNSTDSAFDRFEKVPTTALAEISSETIKPDFGSNLLSDADILGTGEHAKSSLIPTSADAPKAADMPTGSAPMPTSQPGIKLGSTVSGKFAVDMTDIIVPSLFVWLVSMIGYGIDKKQLSLSAKEKETLTPLVQSYLDSVNVNFNNPLNNLLFGLAMVYGSKIVDVFPTAEKLEKKGKKNPIETTAAKVVNLIKNEKPTDKIIEAIGKKRKKGIKDAIEYFNSNKKEFGRENEPDIKLP